MTTMNASGTEFHTVPGPTDDSIASRYNGMLAEMRSRLSGHDEAIDGEDFNIPAIIRLVMENHFSREDERELLIGVCNIALHDAGKAKQELIDVLKDAVQEKNQVAEVLVKGRDALRAHASRLGMVEDHILN